MSRAHHHEERTSVIENGDTVLFKPRAFKIIWGRDTRYWTLPEPDAEEPLLLKQVSWLEVTGKTKDGIASGKYMITFTLETSAEAFGWANSPLCLMARAGNSGKYTSKRISIDQYPPSKKFEEQLLVNNPKGKSIKFGLYEVWTGKWKGGLKIHQTIVERKLDLS